MNQPKWTIRKYAVSSLGNEVALPWMLFQPGVTPPETFHEAYWAACSMQETFNEVLAYIKSQTCKARTVEVELPKVEKSKCIDPNMSPAMFVEKTPGNYGIYLGHRLELTVTEEELKPLALYLLALHYEKENR